MIIHTVRSGDTLYKIGNMYGVSIEKLVADNQITNRDALTIGQDIVVDVRSFPHTVSARETMYTIARRYGVSLAELIAANPQISDPNRIDVGQIINIPTPYKEYGDIEVNGYAVANISQSVLNQTLPYLTYLAIFSYQAKEDGSLYILYENNLITSARQMNVAPLMVITNIGESGGFDSDLAHTILTNEAVQTTFINNVVSILQEKNYYGLDVDFEYIYPYDRESYTQFLRRLKNTITPLGFRLSVAVAPKYRDNQAGILYEAHDYRAIGEIADRVIIMTYEWGYLYGPPLAISPYDQVRQVLRYATSVIPSNKILMGMPNYAYDWTLPYTVGSAAMTLTNNRATELAIEKGATIRYDNTSQAPYFNYTDENGRSHVVWFDNARSTQARLELVPEFNLAGVSYWTINNFFKQNWLVLDSMFNIVKVL